MQHIPCQNIQKNISFCDYRGKIFLLRALWILKRALSTLQKYLDIIASGRAMINWERLTFKFHLQNKSYCAILSWNLSALLLYLNLVLHQPDEKQ